MNLSEDLEALLLRYVDGQLEVAETAAIETLVRHDSNVAAFVRQLQAGTLSYADAFSHEPIEPMPEAITEYVRSKFDDERSK